jgi:DNA-binding MarR family transcriptional regulator
MFDVLMSTSPARGRSLSVRGLTPNDARALWSLDEKEGRPIGTLAQDWECDPSNATFIIDRLERAGLAERRESPADRRVKLVGLTVKGAKTKEELLAEYRTPPPELFELGEVDLKTLIEVLSKIEKD